MYDWASALGEAARMCSRITGKKKFIVPRSISPERKSVLFAYSEPAGIEVEFYDFDRRTGKADVDSLASKLDAGTAGVYIEVPSFFGIIDDQAPEIGELAHEKKALFVVGVDPISLGILKAPGDYGADIVVGEGQPLGLHMNFGGPLLGIFCSRREYVRQMPGRIIGMTVDKEGKRAFCMALQTREQHIRRERATSNICTNNALCAVAAAVYLCLLGPKGLRKLCETILAKSHYAAERLNQIDGVKAPAFESEFFKEFVVSFPIDYPTVHERLLGKGIHGGRPLPEFPELGNAALFCVTEGHAKEEIDALVSAVKEVVESV